ncbi:MAG TPA: DUF349 domain-containing protein [Vicinamibacterales bacterium]|nr:DUF349 domain-containing protein [Vicinamibacterales bacterium]
MGLLDKLKPQPRWKHADPAVRLDAIRELDDPIELAALAETDPDAKVRRAAVVVVSDAASLGRIAAGDADTEVRDRAADRLVTLASRVAGADDTEAGAAAIDAVRALTDGRRLSTIAKSEASDAVRAEALARITDERALGSIARHAKHEATAAAALARVSDANELLDVALHGEHRDVALAAFERVATPETDLTQLRSIEVRAHQKAVSRRARAIIQEREAAEAARQTAALERQRRESTLIESVEHLPELTDAAVGRAELARLTDAWRALGVSDEAAVDRFARATAAADAAFLRRDREAEELADRLRLRAEAIATRIALCERVETLEGDDVLAQLIPIEEEWRSLLPLVGNGPEADRLAERFAKAVTACRKRHELGAQVEQTRASLDALVVEAEGVTSLEDAAAARTRWTTLSREARGLAATLETASRPAADLVARLQAVDAVWAERDAARDAEAGKARQEALTHLQRLTERARRVSEAETITLREGERLMRDITAGLDAATQTGTNHDLDRAAAGLRTLQETIAPRVRELRELDEWRRFANAQRQEQLITMAEAIVTSLKAEEEAGKTSDLAATARALRELHAEWQQVAEAPRQNAQRLWDRFRMATDFIRARCEVYFAARRAERAESASKRTSIVDEAEQLAPSTDWAKTAARFQELQAAWQALGRLAGDQDRVLAQRFRAACNTFFTRRREDLVDRKKVWTDNLAKKEALCEQAEALAESTDWDAAAAEMKRLQAEWKTIGPVRKNKSETIWTRFRAAADRFFERYHHRHEIGLAAKLAEREAIVVELESLAALEDAPADLGDQVKRVRATWSQSVPVPVPGMKALVERWQHALGQLLSKRPESFAGTDLDPATVLHKMEKLVLRVEGLAADVDEPQTANLSQAELLAAKLRSALASNAMGGRGAEESKSRAAADAVRDAQAAWQRLPPIDSPEAHGYAVRFREACRRVTDHTRRHGSSHDHQGQSRRQSQTSHHRPEAAVV